MSIHRKKMPWVQRMRRKASSHMSTSGIGEHRSSRSTNSGGKMSGFEAKWPRDWDSNIDWSTSWDERFWQRYDRGISCGSEGGSMQREIIAEGLDLGTLNGRRAEELKYHDARELGTIHPLVSAFIDAERSCGYVRFGAEHIWLCVLQGLSAAMSHWINSDNRGGKPGNNDNNTGYYSSSARVTAMSPDDGEWEFVDSLIVPDPVAEELFVTLRAESRFPDTLHLRSGRVAKLFAPDLLSHHPIHSAGASASAVAMAAAVTMDQRRTESRRISNIRSRSRRRCASAISAAYATIPSDKFNSVNSRTYHCPYQSISTISSRSSRGNRNNMTQESSMGIRGISLAGSMQSWSDLCMLVQQVREAYSGRGFDWWLYRIHLLCREFAFYYAAQDEVEIEGSEASVEWRKWTDQALHDDPSMSIAAKLHPNLASASASTSITSSTTSTSELILDGWLSALFPLDISGTPVHSAGKWWLSWECIPTGVDIQCVDISDSQNTVLSGFVGTQVWPNPPKSFKRPSNDDTLRNDGFVLGHLESAIGMTVDRSIGTLINSIGRSQMLPNSGGAGRVSFDSSYSRRPSYVDIFNPPAEFCEDPSAQDVNTFMPLLGWVLDRDVEL